MVAALLPRGATRSPNSKRCGPNISSIEFSFAVRTRATKRFSARRESARRGDPGRSSRYLTERAWRPERRDQAGDRALGRARCGAGMEWPKFTDARSGPRLVVGKARAARSRLFRSLVSTEIWQHRRHYDD